MSSKGIQSTKKSSKESKSLPKSAVTNIATKKAVSITKKAPVSESSDDSDDEELGSLSEGSEGDEDEDEDEDVDDAGMQRLMNLLGDGELDDIAQYQLGLLENGENEDGSQSGDEELGSGSGSGSDSGSEDASEQNEDDEDDEDIENKVGQMAIDQDEQEDVDLEDALSIDEDAVPRQKLLINNKTALERIRATFQLDASLPWTETLAVTYKDKINADVNDDLNRELSFYKQALHGAETARALAAKHNLPFTRPSDFYAEMVKSDSHMERMRQRLLDETANIKRGEEKKKEREGKKFGKKVQLEKIKEREKAKKDMEERIRGIKRKRKDALDGDNFEVELEDALAERPSKRHAGAKGGKPSVSRAKRDAKFGFGGKVGRRAKQNTRASTDSFGGGGGGGRGMGGGGGKHKGKDFKFGGSGKKGPSKRPGKSRRIATRGK